MDLFYLTPASISYLNQFLLALLITIYLGMRIYVLKTHQPSKLAGLLIAFFAGVSVFSVLLFLESSLLPAQALRAVYLENTILGVILILLLQFAYHFPIPQPKQKYERWLALALTCAYTLLEAGVAVWRFSLLESGQVEYRPSYFDYMPVIGFFWVVFVFARATFQNWEKSTSRQFALIFIIPLFLTCLNILRSFYYVSTSVYHVSMSVGILFTLFFFVLNFLSSQPDLTAFSAKFSGIILTSSLAVFGSIAWVLTPVYAVDFSPAIVDNRSILFSPNNLGGYTVAEIPFSFQLDLGEALPLTDSRVNPTEKVSFNFPFFDQHYKDIYISNDGALGIGEDIDYKEYQVNFTQSPAIFPLLLDLDPENHPDGKIYLRREDNHLVITYDHVRAFYRPDESYTFQVILYSNGEFSFTYNGLPQHLRYYPNDRPEATIWAIGVKPAQTPGEQLNFLALPFESGPQGIVQDEHLSFRRYLNHLLFPLTVTIFISSLILIFGVPLIIHYILARPLNSLLAGVESMNMGNLDVDFPIQFNDEIGYLANSFNNLSGELKGLVQDLESRVSERTSELLSANEQLSKLSVVVEQSPSTIIITDIDANIEYVNFAFTRSTGYTFEEVKGKNPRLLKSNITTEDIYHEMWSQLTAGASWRGELINKKKSGEIFWANTVITSILGANGNVAYYAAIQEDVTARVLAEQALREGEEQYRVLFELESDAILIIRNADGQILEANAASTALYGYTREELLLLKNIDLSAEPELTKQATNDEKPADQVAVIPLRYHRKKDGTIFPVGITARFITWKSQSVHIAAIRDVTEHKKIEMELIKLATTDPLTGLANRRYFYTHAENIFKRAQQPSDSLAVMVLDIDNFKYINDTYGHAVGDIVLIQLACRLNQSIRPTDILARVGGEEFALLLPRTFSIGTEMIAERILHAVGDKPFEAEKEKIHITVSIGVAELSRSVQDLDTLIRYADQALYKAKQGGRNQWMVWGRG